MFDKYEKCDRQTDGRTDSQTLSIDKLLLGAKNGHHIR